MKILLIHNLYQYRGGEETYVFSLKKILANRKIKVRLIIEDSRKIKTFWDKIKIIPNLFFNLPFYLKLRNIIKKFKPDVVHLHNIYPLIGPSVYWFCKIHNIKVVQHIHSYKFMCLKGHLFRNNKICELCVGKRFPYYSFIFGCYHRSRLASLFLSLSFFFHNLIGTFKLIDKFIFPSEFTRDYYIKHLKIDPKKTYFLPNFVDVPKKLPKIKIKEKNFFLYIGRLSEEKGIIELLDVFKDLPDKKLVVIGDGPLKDKAKQYEKYQNIKYLGFMERKKIFSYMAECKALIIPSLWYEVLPNVLLEALIMRKIILLNKNNNFLLFSKKFKIFNNILFYDDKGLKKTLEIFNFNKSNKNKIKKLIFLSRNWYFFNLNKIYKN